MRRLPIFVCVDVSESMAGDAIKAMSDGIHMLVQALSRDPSFIEIGAMSIISFGCKAKVELPLSSIPGMVVPDLELSSGTCLGDAFRLLTSEISTQVTKTTHEVRGDYKPIVFLITDGQPTDNWKPEYQRFRKYYPTVCVHAVGCGDDVDFSILNEITPNVYVMRDMTSESFGKLFQCVTASVRSVATSVNAEEEAKRDLTEWTDDTIHKPSQEECRPLGESRQILIPGMCSNRKRHFLIRYKKDDQGRFVMTNVHLLERKLEGGEASGGNVNVANLIHDQFKCPCCGNTEMFYCQKCQAMVCMTANSTHGYCPGCNWEGELVYDNFDVRKSRG